MARIVIAGVGIAFDDDSHGQSPLGFAETAFADDMIALFVNDEFCRQQRTQVIAFLRVWSWPEAAAAFEPWISS